MSRVINLIDYVAMVISTHFVSLSMHYISILIASFRMSDRQ